MYLTTDHVLSRICVHRNTLAKWVKAGKFPAPIKDGKRNLWNENQVTVWLQKRGIF